MTKTKTRPRRHPHGPSLPSLLSPGLRAELLAARVHGEPLYIARRRLRPPASRAAA